MLHLLTRGPIATTDCKFSLQFGGLVVATVLLAPHFYTYDLTILLLPMLLVPVAWAGQTERRTELVLSGLVIAVLFVGAGWFSAVAAATGLQLSVLVLTAWLILLAVSEMRRWPIQPARGH